MKPDTTGKVIAIFPSPRYIHCRWLCQKAQNCHLAVNGIKFMAIRKMFTVAIKTWGTMPADTIDTDITITIYMGTWVILTYAHAYGHTSELGEVDFDSPVYCTYLSMWCYCANKVWDIGLNNSFHSLLTTSQRGSACQCNRSRGSPRLLLWCHKS